MTLAESEQSLQPMVHSAGPNSSILTNHLARSMFWILKRHLFAYPNYGWPAVLTSEHRRSVMTWAVTPVCASGPYDHWQEWTGPCHPARLVAH